MIMIFTGLVNSTLAFALTYIFMGRDMSIAKGNGYFTFSGCLHNYGLCTLGVLR